MIHKHYKQVRSETWDCGGLWTADGAWNMLAPWTSKMTEGTVLNYALAISQGIEWCWTPCHHEASWAHENANEWSWWGFLIHFDCVLTCTVPGYKLRTQISTALKTHATVIWNAIQRYNKYAALLNLPRAPLQWEQIVEYSFLAKFDLLWDSNSNIQAKWWASPSYHNTSAQYYELQYAKEEVQCLYVEIGCLLTKIRDDRLKYPTAIKGLEESDPFLAGELTQHWQYLKSVNACHLWCFWKTCSLPGYSGPVCADLQLGHVQPDDSAILHASEVELQSAVESEEECGDTDELKQVQNYIDSLDHHITDTSINE